jgi:hypothetical protein
MVDGSELVKQVWSDIVCNFDSVGQHDDCKCDEEEKAYLFNHGSAINYNSSIFV